MKFGDHLRLNVQPEWREFYLDYDKLKNLIKELEDKHKLDVSADTEYGIALTRPLNAVNAAAQPIQRQKSSDVTQESFFRTLESEMIKIDQFTREKVFSNNCFRIQCGSDE